MATSVTEIVDWMIERAMLIPGVAFGMKGWASDINQKSKIESATMIITPPEDYHTKKGVKTTPFYVYFVSKIENQRGDKDGSNTDEKWAIWDNLEGFADTWKKDIKDRANQIDEFGSPVFSILPNDRMIRSEGMTSHNDVFIQIQLQIERIVNPC